MWDVTEYDDASNDAFQQKETTDGVPILVEETDIHHNRDDMDPEIITVNELMTEHVDDKEDECHAPQPGLCGSWAGDGRRLPAKANLP